MLDPCALAARRAVWSPSSMAARLTTRARARGAQTLVSLAAALALVAAGSGIARADSIVPGQVIAHFAPGQRSKALDRTDVADGATSAPYLPGTAIVDLPPGQS